MSTLNLSLDLPLRHDASALARRCLVDTLRAWGFADEDWLHDAALLVTELVSNAVRHGGSEVTLDVQANGGHVVVAVVDGSDVLPVAGSGDEQSEGGRGIRIVESLTQSWGIEQRHGGKRVWAVLQPAAPLA
ncbi:ATP-binding protein [Motilibacter deserti]|uniref:ATP-binding protein n=1 Tax=Motilibacter deserti TaxID=2714956 RepID=A0ABX0GZ21_9ACTN|nr:ATP-binding protein [Motilibacter deserti]NHC15024.1 ATP-binding protein [Motilibacter deserti]